MPSSPIRDSTLGGDGMWKIREGMAVSVDRNQAEAEGFGNLSIGVDQLSLMKRPTSGLESFQVRGVHLG